MEEEKYGFVYIWYDRKHKRFYIGSHWGTIDDGYICSSRWMRKAYKRRKEDFKRRIIKKIYTNRHDLLEEEEKYLKKIPHEELGKKYYNLRQKRIGNGQHIWNKGLKMKELGYDMSACGWSKGKKLGPLSEETKRKIGEKNSINTKRYFDEHPEAKERQRIAQQNRTLSEETREKIGNANRGQYRNSEEDRLNFIKRNLECPPTKGKKWYKNEVLQITKPFFPGEEPEGFSLGRIYKRKSISIND